jgi:threonine/homoserine/homoserine lactone efflux protein
MSNNHKKPASVRLPNMSRMGTIFATSLVVGLSGALMPGPLLALTISTVAEHGFWAGPTLILGHAIAEIITIFALVKGLGKLLQRPPVIGAIGLLGGAFLLWMAFGLISSSSQSLSFQAGSHGTGFGLSTVVAGLVVSVTNPYWILWWATVGTTYVAMSLQNRRVAGLAVFYAGHESSDVAWYAVVSLLVASGSRFMSPGVYRGLVIVCGIALFGLAAYFIVSGLRSFFGLTQRRPDARQGEAR